MYFLEGEKKAAKMRTRHCDQFLSSSKILVLSVEEEVREHLYKLRKKSAEEMNVYIAEATNNPLKQLWLEQRLFPFGAPYHSKDGTLILPMATFNLAFDQVA